MSSGLWPLVIGLIFILIGLIIPRLPWKEASAKWGVELPPEDDPLAEALRAPAVPPGLKSALKITSLVLHQIFGG